MRVIHPSAENNFSWNKDLSLKLQDAHISLPEDGLDAEKAVRDSLYEVNNLRIAQVKFLPTSAQEKEPLVHRSVTIVYEIRYA